MADPRTPDQSGTVAYRSRGGGVLRCLTHHPGQESIDSGNFHPVTATDLPDGGVCTYPLDVDARCGVDLKPQLADGPLTPADIAEMARYATESRPPIVDIPAEAVEAGARGLCAHDATEDWDDGGLPDTAREAYRDMSRAALTAAAPLLIQAGREQATAGGRVALRELEEATACHCGPAWADRGLHSTHCLAYLRGEVEALFQAAYQAGREAAALAIEAVQPGGDDEYRLTAAKWRHAFATVARGGDVPQDTQPSDLDALIRDLVAITSCWPYPDGGGCQAHKWVEDEPCPHRRAREYLAQRDTQSDCSCGGRRWVDDENWQPEDPRTWRGEREPGNGLVPCGFCNPDGGTDG